MAARIMRMMYGTITITSVATGRTSSLRLAPGVGARGQERDAGQDVPDDGGEQDDQADGDDELGQRRHGQHDHRDDVVEPAVLAQRGEGAQGHAEERADGAREEDQHGGVDDPRLDQCSTPAAR